MDKERLYQALRNADAAGDTQAATRLAQYIREMEAQPQQAEPEKSFMQGAAQFGKNILGGAVRGTGSIGATLMAPLDMAANSAARPLLRRASPVVSALISADDMLGRGTIIGRDDRRQSMDDANRQLGADPDALGYKASKLGLEIAGTGGISGLLAKGAMLVPQLARFAPAIQSGGFTLGNAATGSRVANAAIRAGAGATTGGAMAGLVNPDDTAAGAFIGGSLPIAIKGLGFAGNAIRGRVLAGQSPVSPQKLEAARQGSKAGYVVPPADLNPSAEISS